jgi:hypothetical protein
MAGITLAQAEAKLTEYLAAETAVLSGKQVRVGEEWLTHEDLDFIQKGIDIWNSRVKNLSDSAISGCRRSSTTVKSDIW